MGSVWARVQGLPKLLLSATIITALGAGWLYGQWRQAEAERAAVVTQLETARAQRQDAIGQRSAAERQRLIAERQRQDALQQRSEAERQRQSAEQQRQEALAQRSVAENERRNAEERRQEALAQRSAAERERRNAERQRQVAVQQRTIAERLRLLSVAQSLAADATRAGQTGDQNLGALLAIQALRFTVDNGGSAHDPAVFEALRQVLFLTQATERRALLGHEDEVRAVAFLDSLHLMSAGDDGTLRNWRVDGKSTADIIYRVADGLRSLTLDRYGKRVVVGGLGGHLLWWHVSASGPTGGPQAIPVNGDVSSIKPAGPRGLVAGMLDGGVSYYGNTAATPMAVPTEPSTEALHTQPVLAFGDGPTLVWAAIDDGMWQWDVSRPNEAPRTLGAGLGRVTALTVDLRSTRLAVGTVAGDIAIFDLLAPDVPPVLLAAHVSQVTSLDMAGSDRLVSGSLDNTVRLWRVDGASTTPVTMEHGAWVWSVTFSPDASQIASAGADRAIRLWPTSAEAMSDSLCTTLTRNLNFLEWRKYVGDDIPYEATCANLPSVDG